jgi:5-hydroxyisourate hydrolase-like protein (transthyretin family)
MHQPSRVRLIAFVAVVGLVAGSLAASGQGDAAKRGRKYKAPPPTARIEVTVLRDVNGKPIENAAVVFHPMQGEKDTGNMELKTNEDGKTIIDVLQLGSTVRMQIIAKGFQTYGEDYKIDKPEMAIEIKMKRPGAQYSVYRNQDGTVDTGKNSDGANPAQPAPATTSAARAAKPDDSTKQPDSQSSQPQAK